MTTQSRPAAGRIRRGLTAFAAANVLGFASANAATITMMPLQPLHAESHGAVVNCEAADRAAGIVGAAFVDYPPIAQLQGAGGVARVRVDLSDKGSLRYAGLDRSSGNRWLDGAALAAARALRFSPQVANCVPVAGSYALNVRFGNEE